MRATKRASALIAFAAMTPGCTTHTLFDAKFEGDSPGPITTGLLPAGTPNDRILPYSVASGANVGVSALAPIGGARSLRASASDQDTRFFLQPDYYVDADDQYRVIWTQRVSINGDARVLLEAANNVAIVSLRFANDKVFVNGEQLGACPTNQNHSVIVTANPVNGLFSLLITGSCQLNASGPLTNAAGFHSLYGVRVEVKPPTSGYLMDEITITELKQ
jgi:hypothetical protein